MKLHFLKSIFNEPYEHKYGTLGHFIEKFNGPNLTKTLKCGNKHLSKLGPRYYFKIVKTHQFGLFSASDGKFVILNYLNLRNVKIIPNLIEIILYLTFIYE